jgi:hypothetical protein
VLNAIALPEHKHDGAAQCLEVLKKLALNPGELNVGAVAARKAFGVHRHFLAFQGRSDAANKDDDVRLRHLFLNPRVVVRQRARDRKVVEVLDGDRISLAGNNANAPEVEMVDDRSPNIALLPGYQ